MLLLLVLVAFLLVIPPFLEVGDVVFPLVLGVPKGGSWLISWLLYVAFRSLCVRLLGEFYILLLLFCQLSESLVLSYVLLCPEPNVTIF